MKKKFHWSIILRLASHPDGRSANRTSGQGSHPGDHYQHAGLWLVRCTGAHV